MLYREIISVSFETYLKGINDLCGQKIGVLISKPWWYLNQTLGFKAGMSKVLCAGHRELSDVGVFRLQLRSGWVLTLLGHYAASSGNFLPTFRENIFVPSSGFKNPRIPLDSWSLELEPTGFYETPVRNYHYSLRNDPEERSSIQSNISFGRKISKMNTKVKEKVKCALVQALRLCTNLTAHRESRSIDLLFLDHGTRRRWGVSVTPRPLFIPREDPVSIVQEAGWTPGPVWTGAENLAPIGIRFPDRPARSHSLYRLSYRAPIQRHYTEKHYDITDTIIALVPKCSFRVTLKFDYAIVHYYNQNFFP